jgi:lipopolysaccharide transport system ATP-binding protein
MSSQAAISIRNVGKDYFIHERPSDFLMRQIHSKLGELTLVPRFFTAHCQRAVERCGKRFPALSGVSFEVEKGESVGVIGRNGSGKSTLLQIVAGTLTPTEGEVSINGRVAALLELGSGFSPEFTGKENVWLNASLLGLSRGEIEAKFRAIASFAEIGEFIDEPVRTYSSGMMLRLAFAVLVHTEPEILIIDEALSVGDIFFAQKCARKINEMQTAGTTLLFVSHDMAMVRDCCRRAILLQDGTLVFDGPSDKAIARYFAASSRLTDSPVRAPALSTTLDDAWLEDFKSKAYWVNQNSASSDCHGALILAVAILDDTGQPVVAISLGKSITVQVLYCSLTTRPVHVSLALKNRYDQTVFTGGSHTHGSLPLKLKPGEHGLFEMTLACMLEAGDYTFRLKLKVEGSLPNRGTPLHETPWLGPLRVHWDYETQNAPFLGMFGLPHQTRFKLLN